MRSPPDVPERERRNALRHALVIDATVQVPLVNLGRRVLAAKAMIEDLSKTGARIYLPQVDRKQLRTLAGMRDKFSLVYRLPDTGALSYIWADLVWLDIRPGLSGPSIRLGLDLTNMLPDERHQLERFLHDIAKKGKAVGRIETV